MSGDESGDRSPSLGTASTRTPLGDITQTIVVRDYSHLADSGAGYTLMEQEWDYDTDEENVPAGGTCAFYSSVSDRTPSKSSEDIAVFRNENHDEGFWLSS